jgi:hypothetical protein
MRKNVRVCLSGGLTGCNDDEEVDQQLQHGPPLELLSIPANSTLSTQPAILSRI